MILLPSALLSLLHLALPAFSHASPQPALITTDWELSLIPRHTLFLRQLSDLQTFDSALGDARASPITNSGDAQRPFSVDGDTFDTFTSAAQRSCDNQFKACSDVANEKVDKKRNWLEEMEQVKRQNEGITVRQCDEQKTQCKSAQSSAQVQDFQSAVASTNIGPDPEFPDFDLICEA